ncbi:hypothetical protein [Kitasatospora sp. MMS16-BH015]|uniref:hypothetical protein n=1 Tax=Kitasatospora sp. MMS16-BH015 TaxID=2018025 RepID=UPI00131A5CDA|nr:hypothetical protein [Kitasatospora sp. MMS16-BH015]
MELERPEFWAGWLVRMWDLAGEEERRVADWFGLEPADGDAAWDRHLDGDCELLVPFGDGHGVAVTSLELPTERGTEFQLRHPDWRRHLPLATVDRYMARRHGVAVCQAGPGLAWAELVRLAAAPSAGHPVSGAHQPVPEVHRAAHRLLLLLPVVGDAAVPTAAHGLVEHALASVGVPDRAAGPTARYLLDRPVFPATRWSTSDDRGWWRRRAGGGLPRCATEGSPRSGTPGTLGLNGAQAERLARALGA